MEIPQSIYYHETKCSMVKKKCDVNSTSNIEEIAVEVSPYTVIEERSCPDTKMYSSKSGRDTKDDEVQ